MQWAGVPSPVGEIGVAVDDGGAVCAVRFEGPPPSRAGAAVGSLGVAVGQLTDYLDGVRRERVEQLLRRPELTLRDVARQAGYSDVRALRRWQQCMGRELTDLDPVVEDEVRLYAGIGEKQITR